MKARLAEWLRVARWHTAIALQRLRSRSTHVAIATCCTALALALPTVLLLLVINASELVSSWRQDYTLSVYLEPAMQDQDGQALATQWQALEEIADTTVITRDQAARDFAEATGAGDLITALGENPLPVVVRIWPTPAFADTASVQSLSVTLASSPGVDEIDLDITWLERADAALDTLTSGAVLIGSLLVVIAVLLIGSSVRQQLAALTDEIALSKLLGASDATLRIPFLISGAIIGLLAGLLALGLTAIVQTTLSEPIGKLAASYQSSFQLDVIGVAPSLALVAFAVAIGALGAALAIELRLRQILPE
ncbi:MAG: permease-like cell division protein FtsX [Pseudomonadota bacterium]